MPDSVLQDRLPEVQSQYVAYGPGDAMKVFLSWSGELSRYVALALRDWLPKVIQAIDPWVSSEDIDKGSRWSSDIAKQLATTKAGIVCVTPDNQNAPWLNFEAGALSKTVEKEMVCPYLFQLKPSDVTGPLVQFQMAETNRSDTLRLLATLNRAITPKPLSDGMLSEALEKWWGNFENRLREISLASPAVRTHRTHTEMIEEVLDTVREQARTTQLILTTVTQTRLESLQNNSFSILNAFRMPQNSLNNLELYKSLFDTLGSARETLPAGSMPLGPTEGTAGLDDNPIDPESPQRDE